MSQVPRPPPVRALDHEDDVLDEALREKVKASMADRRPSLPAGAVFKRLRAHHGRRGKAAKRAA